MNCLGNETIYKELEKQTERIFNGTAYLDILSLEESEGWKKGGRRNVEASLLLGTNIRTDKKERRNVVEKQE